MRQYVFSLILVTTSFLLTALEQPRVTVIEFNHPPELTSEEALTLTRLFEGELIRSGAFRVIRQDNVETILQAQLFSLGEFTDPETAVKIGRMVAADHLVQGEILKADPGWVLSVQLVNLETGELRKTASVITPHTKDFLPKLAGLADQLAAAGYRRPEILFDRKIRIHVTLGDKLKASWKKANMIPKP